VAGIKTLGDMKARIADELVRSDLAPQIALAIDDAITEAAGNRFWFNEVRGLSLPLVLGQEYYTSDEYAALTEIDAVYFYVGSQRRPVYVTGNLEMDQLAEGSVSGGEPYRFSRYGDSLRIYPVPASITYTLIVDGVSRLPQLTDDADTNAWMNEGERLVRAIAKRTLFLDVMRDIDQDEIDRQQALVQNYTRELLGKSYDRSATGQMAYND
jgi:hypothetical protein